ncbi:hypothetical protein EDB85DRAFT_411302 [Lactarius pseudohatsudake]|nr:hypothetical protein EDB85DRAFT_411302 [Lactarius pseudohatsudake]
MHESLPTAPTWESETHEELIGTGGSVEIILIFVSGRIFLGGLILLCGDLRHHSVPASKGYLRALILNGISGSMFILPTASHFSFSLLGTVGFLF